MKFEIFTPTVIHELGKRANQEDSVFPARGTGAETDRLFLVCDGMGGHEKGEVASANVIDVMTSWIKQRTLPDGRVTDSIIEQALQEAHNRLDSLDNGAENKMGTTLTLVCLHSGGVAMGHVGDSRIYHIRPSQHKILYKSIDHSLVYELYRNGVISHEEMATSPQRNVITRAIMPGEENKDKIDIAHTTNVQPGDYFYLCSDGMLEQMTDDQLLNVLCADASDVMKASSLVSMTEENKDNHTALLIKIRNVEMEPGDENLINDEHISPYNEVAQTAQAASESPRNITAPIETKSKRANAAKNMAPSAAAAPNAAEANRNAAAPSPQASNKGVNKLLLLLVILLFALVVGLGVYFLVFKKSDTDAGKSNNDDSDVSVEKVDNKNPSRPRGGDEGAIDEDINEPAGGPVYYPEEPPHRNGGQNNGQNNNRQNNGDTKNDGAKSGGTNPPPQTDADNSLDRIINRNKNQNSGVDPNDEKKQPGKELDRRGVNYP